MKRSITLTKPARLLLTTAFWIVVWQGLSLVLPKLVFAGPLQTMGSLLGMLGTRTFWLSILLTLLKITAGYALAFVLGCVLAALGARFTLLRMLLEPAVQVMKSVPVACFVVVALIWLRSSQISVLTAFFVVFPVTYVAVSEGLQRVDTGLLDMAQVFRLPRGKRLRAIYLPSLAPFVCSACRVTVGMALKAGIAGEIIGLPRYSIGEQLYISKLYLNIADLFAWSLVIIAVSLFCEALLIRALAALQHRMEAGL